MSPVRIVIFAKAPLPGFAKTRLVPALGEAGAARLATRMLMHALEQAVACRGVEVELCCTPPPGDPAWFGITVPSFVARTDQGEGHLGERLARAASRSFAEGAHPVFIGTDCPALTTQRLEAAIAQRVSRDLVIHGTADGGYALLGMSRYAGSIFRDIAWGTSAVLEQTLARASNEQMTVYLLETLRDIDEPADLAYVPSEWLEKAHHESD